MKLTAFLFAIYISLLTVQPAVSQIYSGLKHQTETCVLDCCKNKPAAGSKQDANHCKDGTCNPFANYICCPSFNPARQASALSAFPVAVKLTQTADSKIVYNFQSDCFHPPEMA